MPKRQIAAAPSDSDRWFVKELAGENPPSLSSLESLYELASTLYALQPWHILDENELVLVRDPATDEMCYCGVMGALGEVVSMHAYIGTESYRLFRKIDAGETVGAGEFFASQRSVSVEFVSRADLDVAERKLLAALGHPVGRGLASPVFRATRPGFFPWFVTEEEAQTLALCMRVVIEICSAVVTQADVSYWDQPDTYPLLSPVEMAGSEPQFRIEPIRAPLPSQPPLSPVRLTEEQLGELKGRDYSVRGAIELDYIVSAAAVGEKNERKACTCVGLAVDARGGYVFPAELTGPTVPPADVLAAALLKAIQATRALPREVRVRNPRFKDCLAPFSESGVPIKVVNSLPALEQAREHLLGALEGAGFLSPTEF